MEKKNFLYLIIILILNITVYSQPFTWWGKSYNGPIPGSQDTALSIVSDNSGNIYVTGWTYGFGTNADIILIKYNSVTGDSNWVRRYNGTNSDIDKPLAIATDNSGFVYITGFSFQPTRDILTLKYDGSGNLIWARTYNGTNNGGDYGYSITVDVTGNVYVTGRSDESNLQHFTTIKYNSAGTQQWVAAYNGPLSQSFDQAIDVKVDMSGNVFVGGSSSVFQMDTTYDYLTLKYNSTGSLQWAKRYNGSSSGSDRLAGLVLDGSSNVYVTGYTLRIPANYDYCTIKYNSNGDSVAGAFFNGPYPTQADFATCMAIDNSGNIYVTGYSYGTLLNYDYATVKYNSNLVQQWVSRYPGTGDDMPRCIRVINSNVYVTGQSMSNNGFDYFTVKYNSAGNQMWEKRDNGSGNVNDFATGMTVDNNDNVFVTGYVNTGTDNDIFTVRYSPNPIGIQIISGEVPDKFNLYQNYPNPFNPETSVRFDIASSSNVSLEIFDVTGKLIQDFNYGNLNTGRYLVKIASVNYSSGIYFYKINSGGFTDAKKMIIMK